MPHKFSLAAVLSVRQQKEEAEERALTAVLAEANSLRLAIARAEQQMVQHASARAREVSNAHSAAHHQATQARWRMLRDTRGNLLGQLHALEQRLAEQQVRYLRARSDREMLTELKTQGRASWEAEMRSREAKQIDDLFAARRLRPV